MLCGSSLFDIKILFDFYRLSPITSLPLPGSKLALKPRRSRTQTLLADDEDTLAEISTSESLPGNVRDERDGFITNTVKEVK